MPGCGYAGRQCTSKENFQPSKTGIVRGTNEGGLGGNKKRST